MRRLFLLLTMLLGSSASALAQSAEPAVEVRAPSVLALTEKFEYFGGLFGQEEAGKQVAALIRDAAESPKGLDGLDPSRPAGLYAFITKDVIDSPVVLMIPIADEEAAVLAAVKEKAGLNPKKGDDGVYSMDVPNVPAPVFVRFAEKYAYLTLQSAKNLDPKTLLKPNAFFGAKPAATEILSANVHLHRLPTDVKKTVLGQFELKVNDAKKQASPGETEAQGDFKAWALDHLVGVVKDVLTDGQTVAVSLNADPKTDDIAVSVSFSATKGSATAKMLAPLHSRVKSSRKLSETPNPIAAFGINLALADGPKKEFAALADALLKETVNKAGDAEKGFIQTALDALAPTIKTGVVDFAVLLEATDSKGTPALVSALKIEKGLEIEKLVKVFAPFAPGDKAEFTFDVEKVNGVNLHKVVINDPQLEAVFGTKTVWLGFSDSQLLVSIEGDGKRIRGVAKQTPGDLGIASSEVSVARIATIVEKQLPPEKLKAVIADVYGDTKPAGKDTLTLTVDGGDALTVKLTVKGKAVALLAKIDQAKKQ